MKKEDLDKLKQKLSKLSEYEQKQRNLYLRGLANGEIQGPQTEYSSINKPWLKYYSKNKIKEEIPDMSIYQMALVSNKNNMNKIAIDMRSSNNDFKNGIKITYKQFFNHVEKIAKAFSALGVNQDEIVPFILPNIPEARYLIYSSSYIGAVSYPISPLLPSNQLEPLINDNHIKTIFVFEGFCQKYENALKNSSIENIVWLNGMESLPQILKLLNKSNGSDARKTKQIIGKNCMNWEKFCDLSKKCNKDIKPYTPNDSKQHITAIIGTSGTTGSPKGVCLTDYNINSVALSYKNSEYFSGNFMDALIPSIGYGISMIHYQTVDSRYVYLIPELLTTKFPKALSVLKPDNFPGGPVHYINLANSVELKENKIPKCENLISGGATLPRNIEHQLNGVDVGYVENGINDSLVVRQGYGLSENTAMGTYSKRGSYAFGSIGIPTIYESIGIFEPNTDVELPIGMNGEICIQGPTIMKEYLNNREETDKVVKIHSDGKRWIHTKDIGYMDNSGHVFHVDRIKNIFMRTGFNVHPSKIAEFLNTIPFVKNSAVIGFEHPQEQSVPIAFIELNDNQVENIDKESLRQQLQQICFEGLEETSVPYGFVFVDELPINVGGKIDLPLIEKLANINLFEKNKKICKEIKFKK